MDIIIKKLTPELVKDFIYYFDNAAFTDHEEWAGCFCLESHLGEEQSLYKTRDIRRKKAVELIKDGAMNGYLIYSIDGSIIGWCNADDKNNLKGITQYTDFNKYDSGKKTLVVYCFDIAPKYRGMGIAKKVLQYVISKSYEEGYDSIEAYPFSDLSFDYQYRGPYKMYETQGFKKIAENDWVIMMRKTLK